MVIILSHDLGRKVANSSGSMSDQIRICFVYVHKFAKLTNFCNEADRNVLKVLFFIMIIPRKAVFFKCLTGKLYGLSQTIPGYNMYIKIIQ